MQSYGYEFMFEDEQGGVHKSLMTVMTTMPGGEGRMRAAHLQAIRTLAGVLADEEGIALIGVNRVESNMEYVELPSQSAPRATLYAMGQQPRHRARPWASNLRLVGRGAEGEEEDPGSAAAAG